MSDRSQARLLGLLVAATGLATVASAVLPPWHDRVRVAEDLITVAGVHTATGTAAIAGVVLLVVGRGVAQRRRLAHRVTVGLIVAATLAHLAKGDVELAVLTGAVAGLFVWRRRLFVVPPHPAWLGSAARLASAMVAVSLLYGTVGILTHLDHTHPSPTPLQLVLEVLSRMVGLSGPLTITGRFGQWFPLSLTALGAIVLVVVLLSALAPVAVRGGGPQGERDEVRRLVNRNAGDTLDPFVLRRDKRWVFSPRRDAVLGYRNVGGVGLASGDPAGDPDGFTEAVRVFLETCEWHGWRPAIVGVRGGLLPLYRQMGLQSLYIGDEALIDVRGFSLEGRRMRNARQAAKRAHISGVSPRILREPDVTPELRKALLRVAAAQHTRAREFGFSMALGDLLTGVYPDCLIVVCHDRADRPIAFQRYAPCRAGHALSLDVMRRLPNTPNGTNELMIVEVTKWAREHDVEQVSLNFAAFRSLLDPDSTLPPHLATEAFLLQRVEGRFGAQIDTLRRFNSKFHPRWNSRYLAYRSRADLPAVALAALSAEGFLPFDAGRIA